MVYHRESVPGTPAPARHTGSQKPDTEHTGSKKKKRKKLPKGRQNAGASIRKVFRDRDRDSQPSRQAEDRKAGVGDDDGDDEAAAQPSTPGRTGHKPANITIPSAAMFGPSVPQSPTTQTSGCRSEVFVFDSLKDYKIARALFSTGYSSGGSPLPEDADIKATLRWNQVMSLVTSPPIACEALPMKGVSVKIVRPARNGLEARSSVIHKPHGRNPRCEREVLENFATSFKLAFGWEKDGFVLGSRVGSEERGVETPEDGDDDDDQDDEDLTLDIDSI